MNNKGFTLIELMAAIIILAIIMSVTSVSVISFINKSKQKSYEILVNNIKTGAQAFFEECENSNIIDSNLGGACDVLIRNFQYCQGENGIPDECATMKFGALVDYGFLKTSATDNNEKKIVKNPKTDDNMNECQIEVLKYIHSGSVLYEFEGVDTNPIYCPTTAEYSK